MASEAVCDINESNDDFSLVQKVCNECERAVMEVRGVRHSEHDVRTSYAKVAAPIHVYH